ncbi:MAG: hypothetical protein SF052_15395 [Bacteroidia bacterium]|nr:hypothetical protein [Bacteroidia bacterium]
MKKSLLIQAYMKLPLWGKVAVPAVAVFLVISIFKTLSWAFYLGIFAVIAYFAASAVLYFRDKKR